MSATYKMQFGRKPPVLRSVLAVVCAGILGTLLIQNGNSHEQQASDTTAADTKRILPSQVTLSNLEAFEVQMRRDLPVGTPKEEVEAYLTRGNILHSFLGPIYGPEGNSFAARLPDIGIRVIFEGDLMITIDLDPEGKVREIKFRVEYDDAP